MSKPLVMTNTTQPLFSIITVTLNNLDGLKKTHASITKQTCSDYEWIVIDGLSNDGSDAYIKKIDAQFISEADKGIYDAMNKGIGCANGRYTIFMNAGDQFAEAETLALIQESCANTPDFIYGDSIEQNSDSIFHKNAKSHHKITLGMFTHHQAMFYKTSLLKNIRYNLKYKIAADYDLTLRFLTDAKHIEYLPNHICIFEAGGISQQQVTQGRLEQFKIRKNNGIPLIKNSLIFGAQSGLYYLRKFCPKLYWFLKR